ncbi:hypothetical protein CYY_001456 [Polysphondylium violaceum]|uniref:UDENN domain-containing protein n=1 Tax=Polysphondylium violaceum TaxID=133409 RepID=A0A8J4V7Y0_9MYCE|nr:hypothetical protein CYY_001456 [Polysphondylium violaceum]
MMSIPFFKKEHKRTPSGRRQLDITIDVETLTQDEKLSRSLHTGVRKRSVIDRPRLFEWFLVIGVPPIQSTVNSPLNSSVGSSPITSPPLQQPPTLSTKPTLLRSSSPTPQSPHSASPLLNGGTAAIAQPKVLYQYPPDKPLDNLSVEFFPFPQGVPITNVSQTASHTNLFQMLYPQRHLKNLEDSFVFMLTDEKKDVLYGVCTNKVSSIGSLLAGEKYEIDIDENPNQDDYIHVGEMVPTAPKCYCILSKYPFFPIHFNIINGVLSLQHIQEITRFQNIMSSSKKSKPNAIQTTSTSTPLSMSKSMTNSLERKIEPNGNGKDKDKDKGTPDSNNNNNNNIIPTIEITNGSSLQTSSTSNILHEEKPTPPRKYPILECIEFFYSQNIPMPSQTVQYDFPGLESIIKFKRGPCKTKDDFTSDYDDYMLEYGLFTTVQLLTHKTLIVILSAILLEKRVVFYSKTIRSLTSVIFSFISLIKPFNYQSVILPLLPSSVSSLSIQDLLSAPVPYIIGLTGDLPKDVDFSDIVLVDIDQNKIQSKVVQLLPRWQELANKLMHIVKELKPSMTKQLAFVATAEQEVILNRITIAVETHISSLFDNFSRHCIRNVTDKQKISIFVKESFLIAEYPDAEQSDWINEFMKTLIFSVFLDKKLRTDDNDLVFE